MCDIIPVEFDADILEVAVYGTQALPVKNEVEQSIFIKEETEIHPVEENYNSYSLQRDIEAIPLVYTTRLDQMNAFNKIGRHSSKEATEMILAESKPLYKQDPLHIKPEPFSELGISSYIKLCSQVQHINSIVKSETCTRNDKLMKMCKPLKIVLEDFKKMKRSHPNNIVSKTLEHIASDKYVPSSSSEDDEPLSKSAKTSRVSKTDTNTITLAIKDRRSPEADIYIIDPYIGVRSYYRTDANQCNKLKELHSSKQTIVLEYCCWVGREKRIAKFVRFGYAKENVLPFLRKPHACLSFTRPCSCCCTSAPTVLKESPKKYSKFLREQPMTKESLSDRNKSSIILKAYNHMPKVHNVITTTPDTKEPTDYLKCAVIIIKYHRLLFTQTIALGENYEIGSQGEVVEYVKPNVNRSFIEEIQLYKKYDKTKKTYLPYLICCWHKREDILTQLRDNKQLSANALRFIRTPHLCKTDQCGCCCKPAAMINFLLENIETYACIPNITSLYKNKYRKRVNKEHKNNDKQIISQDKTPTTVDSGKNSIPLKIPIAPQKRQNSALPSKTDVASKKNKNENRMKKSTWQEKNHLLKDSCLEQNPTPTTNSNTNNSQVQSSTNDTISLDRVNLVEPSMQPNTLMSSILDRFKDLKLSVNDNGKLTAMIKTRPGQLSTVEIKVLSDILVLASEQVEKLGITPQEFCNRVNTSKLTDGLANSAIPTLTPAYSIKMNRTVNNRNLKNSVSCVPITLKPKSYPLSCKAETLNSDIPITTNKNTISNIFRMMSSLGGQKNQQLVKAYKLHIREIDDDEIWTFKKKTTRTRHKLHSENDAEENTPVRNRLPSQPNKPFSPIPQVAEIVSLKKNIPDLTKSISTSVPKTPQELNLALPILSIVPLEQLPRKLPNQEINVVDHIRMTIDKTIENQLNNPKPVEGIENKNKTSISQSQFIPILPKIVPQNIIGHNLIPFIVNSTSNQTANIFNGNFIPVQSINETDPLKPTIETKTQTPLNVPNSNFLLVHNPSSGSHVSQPAMRAKQDQTPFFVVKNGLQNTIVNDFQQPEIEANDETPIYVSDYITTEQTDFRDPLIPETNDDNSEKLPMNTDNIFVPTPSIDGTSDPLPEIIADPDLYPLIASDFTLTKNTDIPQIELGVDLHQPLLDNSAADNDADVFSLCVKAPLGSVLSENPLLQQMLSKASSSPRAPHPTSRGTKYQTITRVKPLILEHSKRRNIKTNRHRMTKNNEIPRVPSKGGEVKQIVLETNENDIETSILRNALKVAKDDEYSQEEILDAVNNKILIADDDDGEGEGIFGV